MANNPDEFYIGWQAKAPAAFAAFVKKYVLLVLPVVIVVAALLAVCQKKFGAGNFEFGTLTQVTGVYSSKPLPCLNVAAGRDIFGHTTYITVPLIGYGKFGAEGVMAEIEAAQKTPLNNKLVTLKGTLLYNNGKVLLQADGNDNSLVNITTSALPAMATHNLGAVTAKGEIIDPKCFFGVMKPGEGKPHKDCAIRCILGGMPPMLRVMDNKGDFTCYIIAGPNGEKINSILKDHIASPVEMQGRAVQYNDWVVLYVNAVHPISKSSLYQPAAGVIACATKVCR
jgi:hypothetical protein